VADAYVLLIRDVAKKGYDLERRGGIMYSGFWDLNEEWVEPMQAWLTGEYSIASLAQYVWLLRGGSPEGNSKAGGHSGGTAGTCYTSFRAWSCCAFWREGRNLVILRDSILAESLYLRI
jgi:hypothetical protein